MKTVKSFIGEKTEFGPGKTALYYNNVGLFADPFLEERLPNLEKYYNHPSTKFLHNFWNIEESENASNYEQAFQEILNLWEELDQDIPKYCKKERQLQNSWIDKIFKVLGWEYELEESSQKHGVTNFPDYTLFATKEDWKKSKTSSSNHKFKSALAVADAKDWGVPLDGKGATNQNPSFQIINYLKQTDKQWGILTDGKYWRIYSLRSESKHTTYYEVDLEKILATKDYSRFKYFYNFFRVEAFINDSRLNDRTFLDFVFEDGKFYSQRVENNLQERVYKVVDSICQGFLETYKEPSEENLNEVYEYSMYYLFRLMFVLNCESKGLLEVNKQDDYYDFSLRKMCMDIKEQFEAKKTWSGQPKTYNHINDLFVLLKAGDSRIGVHGFGEEPFEIGSEDFYSKHKISDEFLNKALLDLSCDFDEEENLQFIDYKILSPDHIGSLFESLLEFKIKLEGKKYHLVNENGERKKSASYYTPSYIVDYIVEQSLHEKVKELNTEEILKLKVCDPSMGSGHFLLGVLKFFETKIQEHQDKNPNDKSNIPFESVKKQVLSNCVFGVDKTRLAVELAKFSLWIYTASKGEFLETLSDQFKNGNSLVDNHPDQNQSFVWNQEFVAIFKEGGFDAVVGNPPYLGEKGHKEIFREIREYGVLGANTYKRKMDLFYWFIMKGIEIVKPHSSVSFITTNYWPTADGAEELKSYLSQHGAITKYVDFLGSTIFKSAKGQSNSIIFYKKSAEWTKQKVEIFRATNEFQNDSLNWNEKLDDKNGTWFSSEIANLNTVCPLDNSWTISKINSSSNENIEQSNTRGAKIDRSRYKKFFEKEAISRGVETGSDKVSNNLIKLALEKKLIKKSESESFDLKDGIYVLSKKEAKEKQIETSLLLNWYKNSDIGFYVLDNTKTEKLIFVDSKTDITKFPQAKKHLAKFRSLLAAREQANNEEKNWFWIRGPKRDKIYNKVTLVCPYRAKVPKFTLSDKEVYGAGDMYFIIDFFGYSPEVILGYLNSSFVEEWFNAYGKKKGPVFELYQTPLSELPVPEFSQNDQHTIKLNVQNITNEVQRFGNKVGLSQVKEIMDIISENKKDALALVDKKFNDKDVNKFAQNVLLYMSEIDTVVYDVMLGTSKGKATKSLKKFG